MVADLSWVVVPIKWCSPLGAFASGVVKGEAVAAAGVHMRVDSKPRPLMEEAALNCFWDIGGPGLKAICRYMDVPVNPDESDVDRPQALINQRLHKTTPDEMISILEKRFKDEGSMDQLLMSEEIEDLMDEKDLEDFLQKKEHTTSEQVAKSAYRDEVSKLREKFRKRGCQVSTCLQDNRWQDHQGVVRRIACWPARGATFFPSARSHL